MLMCPFNKSSPYFQCLNETVNLGFSFFETKAPKKHNSILSHHLWKKSMQLPSSSSSPQLFQDKLRTHIFCLRLFFQKNFYNWVYLLCQLACPFSSKPAEEKKRSIYIFRPQVEVIYEQVHIEKTSPCLCTHFDLPEVITLMTCDDDAFV